ncbi:MAG: hypothetical protein E6K70_10465 [Planctomycetota bacterium]|nr:MAG: hypothetical protein E6K70_10465 [Planctomycetota bacterium]
MRNSLSGARTRLLTASARGRRRSLWPAIRFRNREWPKDSRLPEVYFDPRSLALDPKKRACMHAKCIVIDRKTVFVSSANFTEAAQERNLEVGLLTLALV